MASLSGMAAERGRTIERITQSVKTQVQQIHISKIKPSEMNFYDQSNIEELADSLELAGMIINPLIVRKTDMGEYEVLSGHRRRLAAMKCVERGKKAFEFLPCIILQISDDILQEMEEILADSQVNAFDVIAKYILITSNSTARELTDYERMMQAMQLKQLIPMLKGDENLKGRALRAEVAKEMNRSDGTIGTYESIYNNLIAEFMDDFKNGKIRISMAAGLASLPEESQKNLHRRPNLTSADVEQEKDRVRRISQTVSESDTVESTQNVVNTESESQSEEIRWVPANDENIDNAIELIFDGFNENQFDEEVRAEMFRICSEVRSSGQVMHELTDIMQEHLPYENDYVRVEKPNRYIVVFKNTNEGIDIPTYYFWNAFWKKFSWMWQEEEQTETTEETVSESDTEEPEETAHEEYIPTVEVTPDGTKYAICVTGLNGTQMCETFKAKDEYEAVDKVRAGLLDQLFGTDKKTIEVKVIIDRKDV